MTAPPSQWPRITQSPRLVASTGSTYRCSIRETPSSEALESTSPNTLPSNSHSASTESNLLKSCQWTPDGTTLLTASEDNVLRTFVLPPTLLSSPTPIHLKPYSLVQLPSAHYSTAIYPLASLSAPESFLFLTSTRSTPIRLHSLLHPTRLHSYTFTNPQTESFLAAASLLFRPSNPNTFLAGAENRIGLFDLHRRDPISVMMTIPTRRSPQTTETMRGVVTALGASEDGVVAAGTYSRMVGLYSGDGTGDVVGVWGLEKDEKAGTGVTQLLWSPDARYLYVVERVSNEIQVFDIRVTGKRVGVLEERMGKTNQRLHVEVTASGEVVAGGLDGVVRVWEGGGKIGPPVGHWQAHDEPVSAAVVHPTAAVIATCSGERKVFGLPSGDNGSDDEGSSSEEEEWDNSLRIWEIPHKSVEAMAADGRDTQEASNVCGVEESIS